jgi:hypothetical protein
MSYSDREKREHVRSCLAELEKGNTIGSYVETQNFSRSAMNTWLKEYRHEVVSKNKSNRDKISFVQVKEDSQRKQASTDLMTIHVGAIAIDLPSAISDDQLKRILLTLKEIS